MNAVAQQLTDAANELAAANVRPLQIRAIDEQMDRLIGEEDLGHVLQAIVRVCQRRMLRDAREGYTSHDSWEAAMEAIDCAAADLSDLDFVGEKIEEDPPCRGCRSGDVRCTC